MEEGVRETVLKAFPGEKVRSVSEVRLRPLAPKEGLAFERKGYGIASSGALVLTDTRIILALDRKGYDMAMAVVALVFIVAGIAMLLQGITAAMVLGLALGFVLFLAVEGVLLLQRGKSPLISFDREKAKVHGSASKGTIQIEGTASRGNEWLTEEKAYEVWAEEGKKLPKI